MRAGERTAVQARSRRRRDALLAAAAALLEERPFGEIAVADIARRARTSVGGVYARFAGKEALLLALAEAALDDVTAVVERELGPPAARWKLRRIVRTWTRQMVRSFRTHRRVLLESAKHLTPAGGVQFRERVKVFNAQVHDRMRKLLLARRAEIGHADPERAVNLALFMAAAAAREAVIAGQIAVYPVRLNDDELADEIAHSMVSYLATKPANGATSR